MGQLGAGAGKGGGDFPRDLGSFEGCPSRDKQPAPSVPGQGQEGGTAAGTSGRAQGLRWAEVAGGWSGMQKSLTEIPPLLRAAPSSTQPAEHGGSGADVAVASHG